MAGIIEIRIEGIDSIRRNFRNAPKIGIPLFQKALAASVLRIQENANDKNFMFKTPRALRTGYLELSWRLPGAVKITGLSARVGPTADYAPFVYFGHSTRGGKGLVEGNPFLERIAKDSQETVEKLFFQAAEELARQVTKQ